MHCFAGDVRIGNDFLVHLFKALVTLYLTAFMLKLVVVWHRPMYEKYLQQLGDH